MSAIASINKDEFHLFQVLIEQDSGIFLEEDKTYLLESRLKRIVEEFAFPSYGDLYRKAKENSIPRLRAMIIDAITTNETLWFRDKGPFLILDEVFLPDMAAQISRGKPKVRIWSAASSTGQEAYSIAMAIHEYCRWHGNGVVHPSHFEILATDISSRAISACTLGAYDNLSMTRGMTEAFKNRYFKDHGREWLIDPELKRMIEFKEFNLLYDFGSLGTFDAIFCRNVAIYFSHEVKVQLFEKTRKAMRSGGIFFLGTSESLTYYSNRFTAREYKGHTYYQA